jgi:hypothetical protein
VVVGAAVVVGALVVVVGAAVVVVGTGVVVVGLTVVVAGAAVVVVGTEEVEPVVLLHAASTGKATISTIAVKIINFFTLSS